jgi:hypothetical protein
MERLEHSLFLSFLLFALGSVGLLSGCQSQLPAEPAAVKELPLERGYYVVDGACDLASNFSLTLNTGSGINAAQAHCEYIRIEKIADNTYSISEECHFIRGGSAERELEITVEDRTSYTLTDGDSTWSAQHCPQESLPEPWRTNDISRYLK